MAAYIALIRKQPENDYGVDFLLIAIDRVSTNRSRFLADSARSSLAQALR